MLHPLGLLVALVDSLRSMVSLAVSLIVVARVIVRSHAWSLPAIVALAVVAALSQPIARWASTRYRLGPDALSFRSGVLFRRDRTISYGSIHAISSSSPIYLQPFGVVRLTVSAAGAGDTDITLDAVPAALQLELERLRASACASPHDAGTVARSHGASTGPASDAVATPGGNTDAAADAPTISSDSAFGAPGETPTTSAIPPSRVPSSAIPSPDASSPAIPHPVRGDAPVFRASTRDILLFAVTDLGFLAAAFVVYGFVQNVQDMLPRDWTRTAERTLGDYAASGVTAVVMLALACVIVLMVVSIVTSLLRFHGFEVWRRGDDLVVVRGLITRRTTTIPVSRIQTIVIRQSLPRRPFRLCSVGLGLSSSATGGDGEESAVSAASVLPVIGTRRVHDVLHAMLPEWDVREPADATAWRTGTRVVDTSTTTHAAMSGTAPNTTPDTSAGTVGDGPDDTAGGIEAPRLRRTGRDLTRYYLMMPVVVTFAATVAVGGVTALTTGWRFWWVTFVPLAVGAWWTVCRWLKSRTEGYAIVPDGNGIHDAIPDMSHGDAPETPADMDADVPVAVDVAGVVAADVRAPDSEATASPRPLPHRIIVTGAIRLTTFTMETRRSRVQSITRATTPWREPRGVERVRMALFVMNGVDELRFMFLHRADADALERWLES
ncbi:PH domain-containing protein [Bifidobacterium sp. MA2]|uniref:PH domain-containing protein n=1 Tax=Bifidobacterium santillanense TaxID=2809028 RepID=A0ABS5URG1_9BIFI|nr:PH domain-containing protein [Bifidobacterium santillanense]MBT1173504.1 PH domain-containing protein [Bifidobacterium santillanense]